LRRALEKNHHIRCERGRGVLVNRVTSEIVSARCKSWRECAYCAWLYGVTVERLFKQLKGLRALVVFTMPPECGDWSNKEHIAAQAQAMRRLSERLFRRFGHRFSMVWTREHNTKLDTSGRLHLNVLWDEEWVDQAWLSDTAAACGFGKVVHISRIGTGRNALRPARGQSGERYVTKCLRYTSKDLSTQTDWPRGTRRWGASRAARAQMKRPDKNPDWFWSPYSVSVMRGLEPLQACPGERIIVIGEEKYFVARSRLERGYPALAPLPDWLVDKWRGSREGPAPPAIAESVQLSLLAPATRIRSE